MPYEGSGTARRLAQAQEDPPSGDEALFVPTPSMEPGLPCLALNRQLGYQCSVSIDRLVLHFPRGSVELPAEQQVQQALASLWQGGLPTQGAFQEVRESIQDIDPTLTPSYLEGANIILAAACNITDPTCL